jgi:hypothetical protein
MTVWEFSEQVTGSITVTIYADTEKEARELLDDGEYAPSADSLCIQCSGYTTEMSKYPVRFSLDLDQLGEPEFEHFKIKED